MGLLDDILRLLGTNRTRARWKVEAARREIERFFRRTGNRGRALAYEHQVCPACGHPAARDEARCPACGEALAGVTMQRAGRLLSWVLPEGAPLVTLALGIALIALYLLTIKATHDLLGERAGTSFTPHAWVLLRYGGEVGPLVEAGETWRLVTAMFLHGNVFHLVLNLAGLWVAGSAIEERFGRARTFVVFVATGVAGALASYFWYARAGFSVGASGAIFGLIGCAIGHALRRRGPAGRQLKERFVPWAIYGLILGFTPGIDNAAHAGGLIAGMIAGALVGERERARRAPAWLWTGLALAVAALLAVCFLLVAQHAPPAPDLEEW